MAREGISYEKYQCEKVDYYSLPFVLFSFLFGKVGEAFLLAKGTDLSGQADEHLERGLPPSKYLPVIS